MAQITGRAKIEVSATFVFSEPELRALDALIGYGDKAFLEVFYKHLGTHYMKPHEDGLKSLFKSISEQMGGILSRGDDARRVFNGERVAISPEASARFKALSEAERERTAEQPTHPTKATSDGQ